MEFNLDLSENSITNAIKIEMIPIDKFDLKIDSEKSGKNILIIPPINKIEIDPINIEESNLLL